MKKKCFFLIAMMFLFCFVQSEKESDLVRGNMEGEKYASLNSDETIWGFIGFGSGCLLSGLGCLASTAIAYLNESPLSIIQLRKLKFIQAT